MEQDMPGAAAPGELPGERKPKFIRQTAAAQSHYR